MLAAASLARSIVAVLKRIAQLLKRPLWLY